MLRKKYLLTIEIFYAIEEQQVSQKKGFKALTLKPQNKNLVQTTARGNRTSH